MADEDAAPAFRSAMTGIEDATKLFFLNRNYEGKVDQFVFFIVSTNASDESINSSRLDFERTGSYVDPVTNSKVKYISVSCTLHPKEVLNVSAVALKQRIFEIMKLRLDSPIGDLPEGFQLSNFAHDFKILADQPIT